MVDFGSAEADSADYTGVDYLADFDRDSAGAENGYQVGEEVAESDVELVPQVVVGYAGLELTREPAGVGIAQPELAGQGWKFEWKLAEIGCGRYAPGQTDEFC